jgi:hypothetical protein
MSEILLDSGGTHLKSAGVTPPEIFMASAAPDGRKHRPFFVLNPATGALEVPANLRPKVEKALRAEARRLQLRFYRRLLGLNLSKLRLQTRRAVLQVIGKFGCYFHDFVSD